MELTKEKRGNKMARKSKKKDRKIVKNSAVSSPIW